MSGIRGLDDEQPASNNAKGGEGLSVRGRCWILRGLKRVGTYIVG